MVKGDKKPIKIYFNGKFYDAKIINVNFSDKFADTHKSDILQIRYNKDLVTALCESFNNSYDYLAYTKEQNKKQGIRTMVKLPDDRKEYLGIYTTAIEDIYYFEPIYYEDVTELTSLIKGKTERAFESMFNYEDDDPNATLIETERTVKIRRLNKKIGDNLKSLYGYRCQICGQLIGQNYDSHVVEAHHIDYFVRSLNNSADNQLIVCPNHHSIIHDKNPVFDRKKKIYTYPNGYSEGLLLNYHL